MIGYGYTYTGLAEFREWLIELRDDRDGLVPREDPPQRPYTLAVRE